MPEAARTNLTQEGSLLRVTFNYSGLSGPCTAAVTPWSLDVAAGKLAEGSYTVDVDGPAGRSCRRRRSAPARSRSPRFPSRRSGFRASPPPATTYSLASTLTAFNNADNAATVTYVGAWDALGESTTPAPVELEAQAAGILDSRSLREGQAVQMLSLRAPRRVALRATLERLETVPEGLPKVPESLGRVELPVFTELFPAGSTAVAGDVSLSALECASGPEARRRVNLTLFNAGTEAATFRVSAVSVMTGPGGGSPPEQVYEVPAKSLVQFNALSLAGPPRLRRRRRLVPDHRRPAVPRLRLHGPPREPARGPALRDLPRARRPLTHARGAPRRIPAPPRTGAGIAGPRSRLRRSRRPAPRRGTRRRGSSRLRRGPDRSLTMGRCPTVPPPSRSGEPRRATATSSPSPG